MKTPNISQTIIHYSYSYSTRAAN